MCINMRSDLEEEWLSSTSIPRVGELIFCAKPDGQIECKVGDGVHSYLHLPKLCMHNLPEKTYLYVRNSHAGPDKVEVNLVNPTVRKKWNENLAMSKCNSLEIGALI